MNRADRILPFLVALWISPLLGQEEVLTDIQALRAYEVKDDGFVLDADENVSIHAVAPSDRYRDVAASAWILNKSSREVVWKLGQARQHNRSRNIAEYDDNVRLPKGEYEVYFTSYPENGDNIENFGEFIDYLSDRIFDGRRRDREYRDFSMTIRGRGQHVGSEGISRWQEDMKKSALLSLSGLSDNDYTQQGFVLEKPTEITIYALGEAQNEDLDDYGWITNAKTGKRVWEMSESNLKRAGGARKNRMVRETMTLPAGHYAAFFVTDGSHSPREWNASPPYDPAFWGITIWVKNDAQKIYAKTYTYKAPEDENVIASLTRVGNHESESKSFTLRRPMDVRIYAVGEGQGGDMADYGWIVDAATHRKVWRMEFDETSHAGGDRKNRMVDKVIHLDKGSYTVHFITDDSHAYRDWNAAAPYDPEHWGITVSAADDKFDPKDVTAYEDHADPSTLASILRVRDDERLRKRFSLDHKSDVRIYAVGEGRDGEMYDYAWIEDANTGRVVWEMRYRMTDRAGGAEKNRLFDGTISLPAGEYTVFYETDGSHAYGDWNDTPPDDPESWGVTVSLAAMARR